MTEFSDKAAGEAWLNPRFQRFHSDEAASRACELARWAAERYPAELAELVANLANRVMCLEGQIEVLQQGLLWTRKDAFDLGKLQLRVNELSENYGLVPLEVPEWVQKLKALGL